MVRDIECGVVNPHGPRKPQRHLADPLPISGNVRDAVADQANKPLVIEPALRWSKDGDSANVAGRRGVLGKPQRAVCRV